MSEPGGGGPRCFIIYDAGFLNPPTICGCTLLLLVPVYACPKQGSGRDTRHPSASWPPCRSLDGLCRLLQGLAAAESAYAGALALHSSRVKPGDVDGEELQGLEHGFTRCVHTCSQVS